MNRAVHTISRFLASLLVLSSAYGVAAAAPRRDKPLEAQLRAHITVLAGDDYEGREPGTEGEAKTLRYLGRQWFDIGLVSGTNDPGHDWFAPVTLVAREPAASAAQFTRKGRRLPLAAGSVLMLTSGKRSKVENAPVLFVGKGDIVPGRSELAGRVALMLDGIGDTGERQNAILKAGASAVLTVLDGERTLESIAARRTRSGYALASDSLGGDLEGFLTRDAADRLLAGSGDTIASLQSKAAAATFIPRLLDIVATMEATTRETTIKTHNLLGKIPGRRPNSGAVLFMAHWDAFGVCAEAPAEDLICNGAIDNASGVAALTEIARRLAKGPPIDRDIYFVATTAEELGLLGALAFAENPPIPLDQIVAAFNLDSVAIAPPGSPMGIVGKGMTPLDAQIALVARQQKRRLIDGEAANTYLRRQDGWALIQHDVPAVLVSTAYGDVAWMERFFDGDYHRPSDGLRPDIELGGAVDDVLFHVALGRWFGDTRRFPKPAK